MNKKKPPQHTRRSCERHNQADTETRRKEVSETTATSHSDRHTIKIVLRILLNYVYFALRSSLQIQNLRIHLK